MRSDDAPTTDIPALIREARQVYQTEPVAAALMLHDGISRLKTLSVSPINVRGSHQQELPHDQSVLRAALWTIDIMGEDAQAGIAPTPDEWNLNTSVAESIVQMLEAANGPS